MRFIVRIPTKDVGLTLEATVQAPNWRDALTRVLREIGADAKLLERAHIHIRRDGRIVVEDPDTLRVFELRSELEAASRMVPDVEEVPLPTKKPTKQIRKSAPDNERLGNVGGNDGRTAIGAPALKLGDDGQYHPQIPKSVQDVSREPVKKKPSDTSPQLPEGGIPVSPPSNSPNRAGFQPVLSGQSVVREEDEVGAQEELPSVIVNLPEEPAAPEPKRKSEALSPELEEDASPEPQAEPEKPQRQVRENARESSDAKGSAAKMRRSDPANVQQDVPVMQPIDNYEDLRSGRSLEVVAGTLLRAVRKRVAADLGVVLVPDSRQKYVLIAAGFGLPKNFKVRRFKFGDGAGGFACEFESPIQLDDPASRPELIGKFEEMFPDAVSIIAFPVRVPNTTFGAIELVRTEGSAFTQEEYRLVEQLCEAQASRIG